jgi:hypothetical protein
MKNIKNIKEINEKIAKLEDLRKNLKSKMYSEIGEYIYLNLNKFDVKKIKEIVKNYGFTIKEEEQKADKSSNIDLDLN